MELRIKEAVWRFESVYASIFDSHLAILIIGNTAEPSECQNIGLECPP